MSAVNNISISLNPADTKKLLEIQRKHEAEKIENTGRPLADWDKDNLSCDYEVKMDPKTKKPSINPDSKQIDLGVKYKIRTLSEGVAYDMLEIATLSSNIKDLRDKATDADVKKQYNDMLAQEQEKFNSVLKWTLANLQRKNIKYVYNAQWKQWWDFTSMKKKDNLMAWRYLPDISKPLSESRWASVLPKLYDDNNNPTLLEKIIPHWLESTFWGPNKDSMAKARYGAVLADYSFDPALDADQDIAAALLIAHNTWGSTKDGSPTNYYYQARLILNDILNLGTVKVAGKRCLLMSDTAEYQVDPMTGEPAVGVDPSYMRPYYYKTLFPAYDPDHAKDWKELFQTSEVIIKKSMHASVHDENKKPVNGSMDVNLTPDKVGLKVDKRGRVIVCDFGWRLGDNSLENSPDYVTDGDGFRTLVWMGLQMQLDPDDKFAKGYYGQDPKVSPYLFLSKQNNNFDSIYSIDGKPISGTQKMYTTAVYLGYLAMAEQVAKNGTYDPNLNNPAMANFRSRVFEKDGDWHIKESKAYFESNDNSVSYYGHHWTMLMNMLVNGNLASAMKMTDERKEIANQAYLDLKDEKLQIKDLKKKPIKTFAGSHPTEFLKAAYITRNVNWVSLARDGKSFSALDESEDDCRQVMEQKWASYTRSVPQFDEAVYQYIDIKLAKVNKINMDSKMDNSEKTKKIEAELRDGIGVIYSALYGKDIRAFMFGDKKRGIIGIRKYEKENGLPPKSIEEYFQGFWGPLGTCVKAFGWKNGIQVWFDNFASGTRTWENGTKTRYHREIVRLAAWGKRFESGNGEINVIPFDMVEMSFKAATSTYNSSKNKVFSDIFLALDTYIDFADYLSEFGDRKVVIDGEEMSGNDAAEKMYKTAAAYIGRFTGREGGAGSLRDGTLIKKEASTGLFGKIDQSSQDFVINMKRKHDLVQYLSPSFVWGKFSSTELWDNILSGQFNVLWDVKGNEFDYNALCVYEAKICKKLNDIYTKSSGNGTNRNETKALSMVFFQTYIIEQLRLRQIAGDISKDDNKKMEDFINDEIKEKKE